RSAPPSPERPAHATPRAVGTSGKRRPPRAGHPGPAGDRAQLRSLCRPLLGDEIRDQGRPAGLSVRTQPVAAFPVEELMEVAGRLPITLNHSDDSLTKVLGKGRIEGL